jgi:hypothetical protein
MGSEAIAASDRLLTMAPLARTSCGRKARVTLSVPNRLTAICWLDDLGMAEIVVDGNAGIVDEHVQVFDRSGRARSVPCRSRQAPAASRACRSAGAGCAPSRKPASRCVEAPHPQARPMPRLGPVIKTLLFAMFIAFSSESSLPGKCRSHPVKPAGHRKLIGGKRNFAPPGTTGPTRGSGSDGQSRQTILHPQKAAHIAARWRLI